jgi:hypothetical protein
MPLDDRTMPPASPGEPLQRIRGGDIEDAQLHPLFALPPVDRERAGDMDRPASVREQRLAELLAGGAERDGADRRAVARSRARIWAWPNSSA